jgi:hypothetical protein
MILWITSAGLCNIPMLTLQETIKYIHFHILNDGQFHALNSRDEKEQFDSQQYISPCFFFNYVHKFLSPQHQSASILNLMWEQFWKVIQPDFPEKMSKVELNE